MSNNTHTPTDQNAALRYENAYLRAELERVTRERDLAESQWKAFEREFDEAHALILAFARAEEEDKASTAENIMMGAKVDPKAVRRHTERRVRLQDYIKNHRD